MIKSEYINEAIDYILGHINEELSVSDIASHFEGPVDQIYTAYQCIFNVWLPKSKHEMDDRYGFEIYRKIDCNSMCMKIDLCIPIK